MTVRQIKLKKSWEQLYKETTRNFIPLYIEIDNQIDELEKLTNKKFKKGKDNIIFREFALIQTEQKMLFQMSENHALMLYALRDYLSEYGKSINRLSEHVETLAKESTNKELTNRIIKDLVTMKDSLDKQDTKINDARQEIEDFDKQWDELFRKLAKDREGSKDE